MSASLPKINMDNSDLLMVDIVQALHARVLNIERQFDLTQLGVDTVVPYRPPQHPDRSKVYPYQPPSRPKSKAGLVLFQKWFNDYWEHVFKTKINFEIIEESIQTISMTEPAMKRNKFLQWLFTEPPIIIDPFAGIGADAITFFYGLGPKLYYGIEHSPDDGLYPEASKTFLTLEKNIGNFLKAYPNIDKNSCRLSNQPMQIALANFEYPYVDMLYLDPPWSRNRSSMEFTPRQMIDYLNETVFSVTKKLEWFKPRVICMKTRFEWDKMSAIQELMPHYFRLRDIGSQPFRGEYHTHVFIRDDPENVWLSKTRAWYEIFENGTPKEKWVKKTGFKDVNFIEDIEDANFRQIMPSDYPGYHYKVHVTPNPTH